MSRPLRLVPSGHGDGVQRALIYAGAKAAEARILILELEDRPSVLSLSTPINLAGTRRINKAALAAADLIYNEIQYANGTLVREWLILNSAAIKNFTAAPAALRPYFRDEAARLRAPDYEYAEAAFHNRSAPLVRRGTEFFITITSLPQLRKTIVIPRLEAVSRLQGASIPRPLRRPSKLDPKFLTTCSAA